MSLHALLQFILKLIVYLNGNEKYYCFLQESAMKRRVNLKYSIRRHRIDRHSEFCDTTRQWVLIKFSEWMWTNLHPGERVEWWDKYPGIHPFHFQHFLCLRLKKSLWRNSLTDILMVCLPSILTLENISIFYRVLHKWQNEVTTSKTVIFQHFKHNNMTILHYILGDLLY